MVAQMGHLVLQVLLVASCRCGMPCIGAGSRSRGAETPACLQKANEQEVCWGAGGVAGGKQERVAEGEGKEPGMTLILSCQQAFSCGVVL